MGHILSKKPPDVSSDCKLGRIRQQQTFMKALKFGDYPLAARTLTSGRRSLLTQADVNFAFNVIFNGEKAERSFEGDMVLRPPPAKGNRLFLLLTCGVPPGLEPWNTWEVLEEILEKAIVESRFDVAAEAVAFCRPNSEKWIKAMAKAVDCWQVVLLQALLDRTDLASDEFRSIAIIMRILNNAENRIGDRIVVRMVRAWVNRAVTPLCRVCCDNRYPATLPLRPPCEDVLVVALRNRLDPAVVCLLYEAGVYSMCCLKYEGMVTRSRLLKGLLAQPMKLQGLCRLRINLLIPCQLERVRTIRSLPVSVVLQNFILFGEHEDDAPSVFSSDL